MDNLLDDYSTQKSQEACVEELATNVPQQGEEEKSQSQSDIFKVHFKRQKNTNDTYNICNYCDQRYK